MQDSIFWFWVIVSWYFHQPHLMYLILVDFYFCRNQSLFFNSKGFDKMLDLAWKGLKTLKFDKTRVRDAKLSKSSNCLWSGKIQISKEKRFAQWRTWETSGCLHERSADRVISFFPVIFYVLQIIYIEF